MMRYLEVLIISGAWIDDLVQQILDFWCQIIIEEFTQCLIMVLLVLVLICCMIRGCCSYIINQCDKLTQVCLGSHLTLAQLPPTILVYLSVLT